MLDRARAAGLRGMVTIGTDRENNRAAVALAKHADIWASVGIHPHDAAEATEADFEEMERLAREPRVVGLGEMGLDFFRNLSPHDVQDRVFRRQIDDGPARAEARHHPLPRRASGGAGAARRGAGGGGGRRHALLLRGCRGGQALPRPGPHDLAGGAGHLQERARAAGRGALRARGPLGGRDRLPLSHAHAASRKAQRARPRGADRRARGRAARRGSGGARRRADAAMPRGSSICSSPDRGIAPWRTATCSSR